MRKEIWNREHFVKARNEQIAQIKRDQPDTIVIDPGDEVVCDRCNALIEDELVVIEDNFALCEGCQS